MPGLNSPHAVYQEVIAYVPFFNLAFDHARPDLVLANQTVQDAIVTLALGARRKPLDAPFVFHANMYVFKFLVRRDIAWLHWFAGELVSQDMKHFLLHHYYFSGLRNILARLLQHGVPAAEVAAVKQRDPAVCTSRRQGQLGSEALR